MLTRSRADVVFCHRLCKAKYNYSNQIAHEWLIFIPLTSAWSQHLQCLPGMNSPERMFTLCIGIRSIVEKTCHHHE